ncbi:MAG TPA: hypothetical protein VE981_10240 [Planctomycetota bacterium]|nr:hypothetical protein [Planctomycetota bacterium]
MAETEVHEKLGRVLVRYEGGRIEPLEFRWGTRDLRVVSLNARWVDRATRPIKYFFSVSTSAGEVCILCHREGDPVWYLESILVV